MKDISESPRKRGCWFRARHTPLIDQGIVCSVYSPGTCVGYSRFGQGYGSWTLQFRPKNVSFENSPVRHLDTYLCRQLIAGPSDIVANVIYWALVIAPSDSEFQPPLCIGRRKGGCLWGRGAIGEEGNSFCNFYVNSYCPAQ